MKFKNYHIPIAILMLIMVQESQPSELDWHFYKEKDSIELFKRAVPGSKLKEFKGVTVMDARIETIIEILKDFSSFPRWMYGCKELKLIRQLDEGNRVVHYVQKTPPLVKSRDVVLRTSTVMDWDARSFTVYLFAVEDPLVPPDKKNIRMKILTGRWLIEDLQREKVRVTFRIMADPAGSIPALLANAKTGKMPYHTLKNMKDIAKEGKYIEAGRQSGVSEAISRYIENKNKQR